MQCDTYRRPGSGRCGHVARAVEVTEVVVGRLSVAGRELVREDFRAHPVDGARVIAVGYGRVPGLHPPHWFTQAAHLQVGTVSGAERRRTVSVVPWPRD